MKFSAHTATALLTGASLMVLASGPAACATVAATPAAQTYDLPAQDLAEALRQIALISGRRFVAASKLLDGKRSSVVSGRLTAEQAFGQALSGSGLQLTTVGDMFVVVAQPSELRGAAPKPAGSPQTMSEITVTGTRIRGQAPIGANLIVLDRNDIDQSGYATTQQLLAALPQNFNGGPSETTAGFSARNNANLNMAFGSSVNLRGLGSDSTLVLLNGQRPAMGGVGGAFADISMVPANIVKRVEVLADGASALYGSDAVAGVVNFIFRDDFEGAETSVHYGSADGYDETQVSQLFGANWGSGHAVFAYENYDHSALRGADRPFATENLVPFGGQDYRSAYAAPGNIVAANGLSFAIPAGSTGVGLLPSQLLAGQTNLTDEVRASDLLPDQQRHSFYASVHQDLGADTTLFAQGLFAERSFTDRIIPGDIPYTVPTTNPFYVDPIGTGQPVTVEYNLNADLGPQLLRGMVQAYDGEIGLDHRFGPWTAELLGSYGFEREYNGEYNLPNQAAIPAALADANPATALNLFGSGASNNPATLNAIRGYSDGLSHSGVWSVSGKVDGPLFELPGGTVRVALGGEYRVESYKYTSVDDVDVLTPMTVPLAGIPGHREIGALFGELAVPLVAPDMNWPGVRKLQLSVAGRFEHYSDVGSTTNPKVGLDWSVVSGLDLRLSYGTSFRAPSFDDLRYAPDDIVYAPVPLPDPKSPTGVTNALLLEGGGPSLKPETATTWNAGIDLKPAWAPGLKASLDYFLVDFRDRIEVPDGDIFSILENRSTDGAIINDAPSAATIASYYASPEFQNPFNVPASAVTAIVDNRTQNIARVHQDGFDFDAGYTRSFWKVVAGAGLGGTYILHIDQTLGGGAPFTNLVATLGEPVRLRLRGRLTAASDPWSGALFVNYTGAYTNQTFTPTQPVGSWTTVDAQLAYAVPATTGLLHGLKLSLNVTNLFDTAPPYVENFNGLEATGWDAGAANPLGRVVSFQIVKAW